VKTPASREITEFLLAWNAGEEEALTKLMPVVYKEKSSPKRGEHDTHCTNR
jgi:hypothetical protein